MKSNYLKRALIRKKEYEKYGIKFFKAKEIDITGNVIKIDEKIEDYASLFDSNTIAFWELIYDFDNSSSDDEPEAIEKGYKIYINVLKGNLWLAYSEGDEGTEETGDFFYEKEENIDQDLLIERAILMAKSAAYALLRNNRQRYDFAMSMFSGQKGITPFYFFHLIEEANSYFSNGILPIRVKKLSESGKSLKEIAETLSISKDRVRKVLAAPAVDFIIDRLKDVEL